MQCKTVQKQLDRFVRRELAPRDQSAIESHLEQCEVCRQCLEREKSLVTLLKKAPEPPALPEGFEDRIIKAARQRQSQRFVVARQQSWLQSLLPSGNRAAQATVLVGGILLGILMGQQTWRSAHPSSNAATHQNNPQTAYRLDCLSDAPDGSLAESFLILTASSNPSE